MITRKIACRLGVVPLCLCMALSSPAMADDSIIEDEVVIIDDIPEPAGEVQWYSSNKQHQETDALQEASGTEGVTGSDALADSDNAEILAAIEDEEKERRSRREEEVRGQLAESIGGEAVGTDEVHYICTESGTDYISLEHGGEFYVYGLYISRDGKYFVSSEGISDEAKAVAAGYVSEGNLVSDEQFWNKATLLYTDGASMDAGSLPRDENGIMCVPYFCQSRGYWCNGEWAFTDWPDATFNLNGHPMRSAGCGFFSTAMAISYMRQLITSPVEFKENGQYVGQGSAVTVGLETAKMYGISAHITSDFDEVLQALANGYPVLEHVGSQPFTSAGHYICLVGLMPDGTVAVNDPSHPQNSYWYSYGTSFSQETIRRCAKDWSTAFTIFGY